MSTPKYTVKNVKTFRGMEGTGYECMLYRDGKCVATVTDTADGGDVNIYWKDARKPRIEVACTNYKDEPWTRKCTPEEAIFVAHLETLPKEKGYGMELKVSDGMFIERLVSAFEEEKQVRRWCKSKTVFKLKGDAEGSYRTVKAPYGPKVKAFIMDQYGDKVVEILNERFAA